MGAGDPWDLSLSRGPGRPTPGGRSTRSWYPTTEGPYFLTPEYLLLRVGSGTGCRYNVLVRVSSEAEADYRWYVRAHQHDQAGETVFAAYLWDRSQQPESIVGGGTMGEARAALETFLT